jgi:hypothetical protein
MLSTMRRRRRVLSMTIWLMLVVTRSSMRRRWRFRWRGLMPQNLRTISLSLVIF